MSGNQTTLVGVFYRERWRSSDSDFAIAFLEDGTCIKGESEEGDLQFGLTYQFFGTWVDSEQHGKQFAYEVYTVKEPLSRGGIVVYLEKYAPNIGTTLAGRLYDAFEGEAVRILRTNPELAAKTVKGGDVEKFKAAAAALQLLAKFEDTKIELTQLFHGRGFSGKCIEECVAKLGILAPARIKRDPFWMLVEKLPSAGFDRCNKLYIDLGLPKNKLKRQMICMWHAIRGDRSGNTWMPYDLAVNRLKAAISDAPLKVKKAVTLGKRSRWLSLHKDGNGNWWIAENEKAFAENYLAKRLGILNGWQSPPSDSTPTSPEPPAVLSPNGLHATAALEARATYDDGI